MEPSHFYHNGFSGTTLEIFIKASQIYQEYSNDFCDFLIEVYPTKKLFRGTLAGTAAIQKAMKSLDRLLDRPVSQDGPIFTTTRQEILKTVPHRNAVRSKEH